MKPNTASFTDLPTDTYVLTSAAPPWRTYTSKSVNAIDRFCFFLLSTHTHTPRNKSGCANSFTKSNVYCGGVRWQHRETTEEKLHVKERKRPSEKVSRYNDRLLHSLRRLKTDLFVSGGVELGENCLHNYFLCALQNIATGRVNALACDWVVPPLLVCQHELSLLTVNMAVHGGRVCVCVWGGGGVRGGLPCASRLFRRVHLNPSDPRALGNTAGTRPRHWPLWRLECMYTLLCCLSHVRCWPALISERCVEDGLEDGLEGGTCLAVLRSRSVSVIAETHRWIVRLARSRAITAVTVLSFFRY